MYKPNITHVDDSYIKFLSTDNVKIFKEVKNLKDTYKTFANRLLNNIIFHNIVKGANDSNNF